MDLFDDAMPHPRTGANSTQDPTQPRNLHNPGRTFSEAILRWDMPLDCSGFIGYDILCAGRETVRTVEHVYIAQDLTPETPYLFEIQPRRTPDKPLALSQSITVITHDRNPPTKPKALKVTELTSNSATLCWGASESRTGEIRYRVYVNGALIAETDQLHYTLLHLRNFSYFKVKVRAVLTSGLVPASVPASIKFRTLLRPPLLSFSQRNGIGKLSWAPNYWAFPSHEGTVNGHGFTRDILALSYKFMVAERSSGPPYRFDFQVRAKAEGVYSEFSKLQATVDEIIPPSPPGTPMVNAIGDTSVTLSWAPSTDNKAVTGYRLIRWGGGELWDSTVVTDASCTYTDLNSGSRYLFVVRAQDAAGNESIPSEVMFRTTGTSTKPEPLTPKINVYPTTSTSAVLEWTFEDTEEPPAGVRITLNGVYYSDVLAVLKSTLLENLVPDTEYTIAVYAYTDLALQISEPAIFNYVAKDCTPPSVPGNLRVVEKIPYSVSLAWEESTDDIGMYGYVIYDGLEYCDEISTTQYTATHLYPGTHLFHVRALDIHGNASEPAFVLVKVPAEDITPPSRPGVPIVSDLTDKSVKLTWAPSADDGEVTYKCTLLGGGRSSLSVTDAECTYTDLSSGRRYLFVVQAEDVYKNESISSEVMFTTQGPLEEPHPLPPLLTLTPRTSTSARLDWTIQDGTGTAAGVRITINGVHHSDVLGWVKSKVLEDLVPGTEYTILVYVFTLFHYQISEPAEWIYVPNGLLPSSVSANLQVTATTSDSVTLAWDELASDSGADGYLVYNHHKHVGSTLGTRYTVVGLSPGSHSFSLRSVDLEGNITELGTVDAQLTG